MAMSWIELLKDPYSFFMLLSLINIGFYLLNYLFSSYWGSSRKQTLKRKTLFDFGISLVILMSNILVAIPGYWLFYYDYISFDMTSNFFISILHLCILVLLVDFIMYMGHKMSHYLEPFKSFHDKYHTHKEFNELSLYVMHPAEVLGLGMIFTLVFYGYSFSFYAVVLFLIINWFWGVIAHFNVDKISVPFFFSNNLFHAIHHRDGRYNLGFYTVFWDKVFGTFSSILIDEK
ncbi:MAG: Unknown protein [uncultured Sulfurovum sp.]|uniref:Fatty acid hydroxylase domain-containing protein n=1 Tax=uncultured Sulfurovum sp. TaxID=269237 RepID=A0A6S6S1K9_9BACT|nr:MAG: Unknown protein [uncultured Sulfurovum sp.]